MAVAVALIGGFVALCLVPPPGRPASAFRPEPGWIELRSFHSPHATQAACADRLHAFAISNTTVAIHDRRSGRLLGEVTGPDTKHLNSGFLSGGRIWCAHSNYPLTPHESDVRVCDPAEGALSVFHRFPEPPGSLVWCVKRPAGDRARPRGSKEGWWCCFAHYGVDNSRTVLVEYGPEGNGFEREVRRFTFPRAVVDDFDGMSGSGGLFDDGDGGETLLVSHHHYRVLYRLALPREGSELELVEVLSCPFPGQGIAADPETGGLVGIDRQRRAVVFAEPAADASAGGGSPGLRVGGFPQLEERPLHDLKGAHRHPDPVFPSAGP